MNVYKMKTRVFNSQFSREIIRRVKAENAEQAKETLQEQWKAVNDFMAGLMPSVNAGLKMEIVQIEEDNGKY